MFIKTIEDELEQGRNHTVELSPPPVGKNVLVQCDGYRCLAYRTNEGTWRGTYTREEISDVRSFSLLSV